MADIVDLSGHIITGPLAEQRLYEVPNASMEVLQDVLNATWNLGLEKSDLASAKIDEVTGAAGIFDPANAPEVGTFGTVVSATASGGTATAGTVSAPGDITVGSIVPGTVDVVDAVAGTVTPDVVSAPTVAASAVSATTVSSGTAAVPTITAPAVNIPANIDMPDLWDEWKTEYLEIAAWLVTQYSTWISTYAPNNQALYTAAENSLLSAIQSDNYLPASLQANILGEAAAATLADKVRAQDAVVAMFASRRFPMPAAASLSAVMQIEEKAMDSMAAASRQIAVMSVEQYRFVITQVMAARGMVLNAANAFVLAVASAPDAAGKLLGVGYDVQTKLIDAAASFYSADAQAKKIIAEVGEFNVSSTLDASKTTANLALEASKSTVGFALEADKAEAGFSLEAGKATAEFALDARKLNVNLGFEASKMNASSAMDADKVNAQLALEAAKSFEGFVLDARKAYLALVSEVGRENARLSLEASKTNAETTLRASTHNATLLHETSKLNVGYALEAEKANLGAVISITDFNSRAILEELRLITSQAVAALNNLHIGISMSAGGTNITSAAGEYA